MSKKQPPLLNVDRVSKLFTSGRTQALNDISFKAHQGEFLSIYGPSGSGKTTLLYIIAGLIRPSKGEVFIRGKSLSAIPNLPCMRRKTIGFIFQDFYLYPSFTVLENVLLPNVNQFTLAKKWVIKAETLLHQLGIHRKARQNINELSCGERQRVCIARALLNDPALILADEPTGSLDSENSINVLEILQKINEQRNTTILMVTHDTSVSKYAHRNIEIIDGKIRNP
ncbi:MAG: ABC transporter ATP-binding protein [Candidatus Omnitrophica bacterium]|nr:ABC transporter ATP-binding protein [Candidatus Omnitrophota bacterium]